MDNSLYKYLTLDDKLNILRYEKGHNALSNIRHYEILKTNPDPTPKPNDLYISNVLGIDFEHFKKNVDVELVKRTKDALVKKYDEHHIVDALLNAVHSFSRNYEIDLDLVGALDGRLKEMYELFLSLSKEEEFVYVESGVKFNGEELYKRVKK